MTPPDLFSGGEPGFDLRPVDDGSDDVKVYALLALTALVVMAAMMVAVTWWLDRPAVPAPRPRLDLRGTLAPERGLVRLEMPEDRP